MSCGTAPVWRLHVLASALLGVALVWAPLAASAQPLVVPIATTACASGTPGVQVGDTCHPAPSLPPPGGGGSAQGGLQVLVLSRNTLALVSNHGLTTNVGSQLANCNQQNAIAGPALAKLTSASNLVILSSVGQPSIVPTGGLCLQRGVLGQALYALGGSLGGLANPTAANIAYSLVGIPGLGMGNGWEWSPTTASMPAGLTGYLAQDVNANYAFLPGPSVQIVTRTTDGSGNPAVQVGSTTLSAAALPAGAQGGYQVVLVDRHTGAAYQNDTYFTNMSDANLSLANQQQMNTTICCPSFSPFERLVVISSIGDPGALLFEGLGDSIQALGGTGAAALGAGVNYSLVGIQNASASTAPPEASSAINTGIAAQLTAIVRPNKQGLYTPVSSDFLGSGAVNYGLYGVLAQPPSAWPVPASGSAGQAAAFQYLSLVAQDCPIPATPPVPATSFPACAAGAQTGCSTSGLNIRSRYCDATPLTSDWKSAVSGQKYERVPHPYRGEHPGQFTEAEFTAVQHQLAGTTVPSVIPGEFDYVGAVSTTLLGSVQGLLGGLAVGQNSALNSALEAIVGDLAPPPTSSIGVDLLKIAEEIVSIASAVAALAEPEVRLGLGLVSAALQGGLDLVTSGSGASAAAIEAEVDDLASQLFLAQQSLFAQTSTGVAQLFNAVLTDWTKLQTVGQHVLRGDAGWHWSDTTGGDIAAIMAPGFQVGFYKSLLPVVSDVVFFEEVPFNTPVDYVYLAGSPFSTCHQPYINAPSYSYTSFDAGSSDGTPFYDIYLLDPYISQTVANQLFNGPTATSPGLGIFPARLYQQVRGWNGLRQVFPVDWPNYVYPTCFSGAPLQPLPLRGQASKVGAPGETGLISIDTEIAPTGPIDLSAATLSLRQVLVEADGAGELVRGPGGNPLPLLDLPAARGSRPNRATFKTPAGARPIVTVEVTNRDVKTGKLQVSLTVDRAAMPEGAQGCATGDTAVLRTRFIIDDGLHPPVPFNVEQPWRCNRSRLKTP